MKAILAKKKKSPNRKKALFNRKTPAKRWFAGVFHQHNKYIISHFLMLVKAFLDKFYNFCTLYKYILYICYNLPIAFLEKV